MFKNTGGREMKENITGPDKDSYKIIMSELGVNPFSAIKVAFALMGLIPLLVLFYIVIGKHFLYHIFLGSNSFILGIAIFISGMGFFYAYSLVRSMTEKLLLYSLERKRADDEKSAFVSNVSHEFKNPLNVIKGSLSSMIEGVTGTINSQQKEMLELGKKTVDRLIRLVRDLLDLSKIEAGKMEIKKEEVDIVSLADEVLTFYEREISKKEILLKKEIPQDIGLILADKDKLVGVITNLLNNAVKYTPAGGKISVGLEGTEREVRFEISDTGPGIPKESYEKIFNKFERITAEKMEGTGLGLPITKDIIELHKGKIWVESGHGKGSKFIFTLPRD